MKIQNGDHLQYEVEHVHTPPEQRSDWPLPSFDARDWAKAFCKRHPTVAVDDALAWFAPALMRGFDEGTGRAARELAKMRNVLQNVEVGIGVTVAVAIGLAIGLLMCT